jgi:hypothetical protein
MLTFAARTRSAALGVGVQGISVIVPAFTGMEGAMDAEMMGGIALALIGIAMGIAGAAMIWGWGGALLFIGILLVWAGSSMSEAGSCKRSP